MDACVLCIWNNVEIEDWINVGMKERLNAEMKLWMSIWMLCWMSAKMNRWILILINEEEWVDIDYLKARADESCKRRAATLMFKLSGA